MNSPAHRHRRAPVRFASKADPMALAQAGLLHFREGKFQEAHLLMQTALPYLPDLDWRHLHAAALTRELVHPEIGQAIDRGYLERHPTTDTDTDARVLVMRGFDETYPVISRSADGGHSVTLRGGHFTLQYLSLNAEPARRNFTIPGHRGLNSSRLPTFDLMINTIADPDLERASLESLSAWLADHPDTNLINHPDRVLQTTRDANYQRLRDIDGVIFPLTVRLEFDNADALAVETAISQHAFTPPIILRQTGTHTARTTELLQGRDALKTYVGDGLSGTFYAIQYREILWQNSYFRKLRLFHIDGEFYPVVCHLDKVWNVHGGNRKDIMRGNEPLMAEEQRFLNDWKSYVGVKATDAIYRLAEATALDFFGMDFTIDDQGRVFIYELNPSMRHSFDHAKVFPYKLPHDQAISAAFAAMIDRRLGVTSDTNA